MPIEIKVPVLPESVSDATLMEWHKNVGDTVTRDENLIDLETEKVVLEVPAPADGVLKAIKKQSGDTVTANEVLAILETDGAAVEAAPVAPTAESSASQPVSETQSPSPAQTANEDDDRFSPAVRRLLDEHNLDPTAIAASGKDGRLTKEDILKHLEPKPTAAQQTTTPTPAPAPTPAAPPVQAPPVSVSGERNERREPMTRLRQTIATRLVQSQQNAALLTTFNEVDLTEVMTLRKKYKESFEKKHGTRLGFMSFFVKAAVEALQRIPAVNAYIEGTDIVYHDYCDIGIAVSSPRGLVVPIVRDAQHKSFAAIEAEISEFGQKARDGKLGMDDLTGGTFTITNGGVFGSLVSTPIVNPPQSAILGMHKIQERPMAVNGEVVIRPMMYLAMTYDHRIIDGREAVTFLVTIKESLEDPARLLLQV